MSEVEYNSRTCTSHPKNKSANDRSYQGASKAFRFNIMPCKKALTLGLTGSIRNLPDGRVEALIQGDRAVLEAMSYWFWKGSPESQVEAVETETQELQMFQAFEIQY